MRASHAASVGFYSWARSSRDSGSLKRRSLPCRKSASTLRNNRVARFAWSPTSRGNCSLHSAVPISFMWVALRGGFNVQHSAHSAGHNAYREVVQHLSATSGRANELLPAMRAGWPLVVFYLLAPLLVVALPA